MKKAHLPLLASAALLLLAAPAARAGDLKPEPIGSTNNIIVHGGFERSFAKNANEPGWVPTVRNGGEVRSVTNAKPEDVYEGSRALKLFIKKPVRASSKLRDERNHVLFEKGLNDGDGPAVASVQQDIPVIGGRTCQLRYAWRSEGLQHLITDIGAEKRGECMVELQIIALDAKRKMVGTSPRIYRVVLTKDAATWTTVPADKAKPVNVAIPSEAAFLRVSAKLKSSVNGAKPSFWLDALELLPPPAPAPAPAAP